MSKKQKLLEIDPADIKLGTRQREDLGDIEQLKESIKAKGQIQPITISTDNTLVSGGRRLEAIKQLGDRKILCVARNIEDELDLREVELFENIHRKEMTWQERARSVKAIHELMVAKFGDDWSQRTTASLLGKSQGNISDSIQLAGALDFVPELSNLPTADAARQKLNRLVNDVKIRNKLREAKESGALYKGLVKYAGDHYKVGDALVEMEAVADCICNFAEVDPPYAIALDEKREARNEGKTSIGIETYNEIPPEKYLEFLQKSAKQVFRILDFNSYCVWWFGPTWHQTVLNTLRDVGFKVDDIPGIWYKIGTPSTTAAPNIHLSRSYEPFFICRKGNPQLNKKARSNVFTFEGVNPANRIHATERPIELMEELLETFTIPSARILVPFLGSGNTLLACYRKERLGFGWDLSEEHKIRFLDRAMEEKSSSGESPSTKVPSAGA